MYYLLIIVPLLFVYLELSSNFELSNIIVGLIIVTGIVKLIRPHRLPTDWRRLPSSVFAMVRYLVKLVFDVIASADGSSRGARCLEWIRSGHPQGPREDLH